MKRGPAKLRSYHVSPGMVHRDDRLDNKNLDALKWRAPQVSGRGFYLKDGCPKSGVPSDRFWSLGRSSVFSVLGLHELPPTPPSVVRPRELLRAQPWESIRNQPARPAGARRARA